MKCINKRLKLKYSRLLNHTIYYISEAIEYTIVNKI